MSNVCLEKENVVKVENQTNFKILIFNKLPGIFFISSIIIAASFAACDTTEPDIDHEEKSFIQMKAGSGGSSATIQSSKTLQGTISVNDGANEIEIREVKFFLEEFEIEVDLDPPLEISETSQSTLVIEIFVPIWFMGADGMIMNPKEQKNTEKINDNIESSFEAFEDSFEG
jgi:hypothetical protein